MPTSSGHRPQQMFSTIGLTAIVALVLLMLAWLIPVETRNSRGDIREMNALDVWREALGNVPANAPVFLTGPVLTIASLLALFCSAYVIVAIARLPR